MPKTILAANNYFRSLGYDMIKANGLTFRPSLAFQRNVLGPKIILRCSTSGASMRHFSCSSIRFNDKKSNLKLSNTLTTRIWPDPFKSLKNVFFTFLIKSYFDQTFAVESFMEGAVQAAKVVSKNIALEKFENLDGLVEPDIIEEIKHFFYQLSSDQRNFIKLKVEDVYLKFIYEIGVIFDDNSGRRFVEITTVIHGLKDRESVEQTDNEFIAKNLFVLNYCFRREFTKDVASTSKWTISKLNHFLPDEVKVS